MQPAYLLLTGLTAVQMALEPVSFGIVDGIQRVDAGQRVQIMAEQLHQLTPMQSRNRMRPSRILVLIVPSATSSSPETSR